MVSAVFHSPLDAAGDGSSAHRTLSPGKAGAMLPTAAKPAPPAHPRASWWIGARSG